MAASTLHADDACGALLCRLNTDETGFDEATFAKLCQQIKKQNSVVTEQEKKVLRDSLVQCYQSKSTKQFCLQLTDGPRHRSLKQLLLEWDQRKQVGCAILLESKFI